MTRVYRCKLCGLTVWSSVRERGAVGAVYVVGRRYKLSDVARIAEVLGVTAACVDESDDTFVEVLTSLIRLCAKVSAPAALSCTGSA